MNIKILLGLTLFFLAGCAGGGIDRSEVNRPAMDLSKGLRVTTPMPLTHLRSTGNGSVNSCTVCAH